MIDFTLESDSTFIRLGNERLHPPTKDNEVKQFTQAELQQLQSLLRDELRLCYYCAKAMHKDETKKYKSKAKRLAVLQTKVKQLANQ